MVVRVGSRCRDLWVVRDTRPVLQSDYTPTGDRVSVAINDVSHIGCGAACGLVQAALPDGMPTMTAPMGATASD